MTRAKPLSYIMPGSSSPLLIGSHTMNYFQHSSDSRKKTSSYRSLDRAVNLAHLDIRDVEDALRQPLHQLLVNCSHTMTDEQDISDEQDMYYRQARDLRHTEHELKRAVREMSEFTTEEPS
jgi:hypothetical protein